MSLCELIECEGRWIETLVTSVMLELKRKLKDSQRIVRKIYASPINWEVYKVCSDFIPLLQANVQSELENETSQ